MGHSSLLGPAEEIAEFFARGPSPEEIAAFRLSDATLARMRDLLEKNAAGSVSREESEELDLLVLLDRIVMLIRRRPCHAVETAGSAPTAPVY